jgi:hypothetical protein
MSTINVNKKKYNDLSIATYSIFGFRIFMYCVYWPLRLFKVDAKMLEIFLLMIIILGIPNLITASFAVNEYLAIESSDSSQLNNNDKTKFIFNIIILLSSALMLLVILIKNIYIENKIKC